MFAMYARVGMNGTNTYGGNDYMWMFATNMYDINVKNKVDKWLIGDVVAHLKPQKFTVSLYL